MDIIWFGRGVVSQCGVVWDRLHSLSPKPSNWYDSNFTTNNIKYHKQYNTAGSHRMGNSREIERTGISCVRYELVDR